MTTHTPMSTSTMRTCGVKMSESSSDIRLVPFWDRHDAV